MAKLGENQKSYHVTWNGRFVIHRDFFFLPLVRKNSFLYCNWKFVSVTTCRKIKTTISAVVEWHILIPITTSGEMTEFSLSLWECYIRTEEKCGLLNFSTRGLAVVVKTNSSTRGFVASGELLSPRLLSHLWEIYFYNFSCRFLNPNNFFQFES